MNLSIGNKIKALRKEHGITQEQLADSIGISFQAVSKWENNIALPDITLVPILAGYFNITMMLTEIMQNFLACQGWHQTFFTGAGCDGSTGC